MAKTSEPSRTKAPSRRIRLWNAVEPRSYDRLFYARVLVFSFLLIALALSIAFFSFYETTKNATSEFKPSFDLSGLFPKNPGASLFPISPCIVIQEYLEELREGGWRNAYSRLSSTAKRNLPFNQFLAEVRGSSVLFKDASSYRFSLCELHSGKAKASGWIGYRTGGRSAVRASFEMEGGEWKILEISVVYE